ncbi:unnamed protein product, partial [Mesorhabditis spiculigera]
MDPRDRPGPSRTPRPIRQLQRVFEDPGRPMSPAAVQQARETLAARMRRSRDEPYDPNRYLPDELKPLRDRRLPPQMREVAPESYDAYMKFLGTEKRIDTFLARKKLEMGRKNLVVPRTLRVFVSHQFFPGDEDGKLPMWELRVEGRLLGLDGQVEDDEQRRQKFSTYLKSLVLELDREMYGPDNCLVEWHRFPNCNETDGFQIKRPGDRPLRCKILILPLNPQAKLQLKPMLQRLLGIHCDTRDNIRAALWTYIKTHKLQDAQDHIWINNDRWLQQIFGCERMRFCDIPHLLQPHLMVPEPARINYRLENKGPGTVTSCYDINIDVGNVLAENLNHFNQAYTNQADMLLVNFKIDTMLKEIIEKLKTFNFYIEFAQDPRRFVNKWVRAQSAELRAFSDLPGGSEADRMAETYQQPAFEEAVGRYLYMKINEKRGEMERALGLQP